MDVELQFRESVQKIFDDKGLEVEVDSPKYFSLIRWRLGKEYKNAVVIIVKGSYRKALEIEICFPASLKKNVKYWLQKDWELADRAKYLETYLKIANFVLVYEENSNPIYRNFSFIEVLNHLRGAPN